MATYKVLQDIEAEDKLVGPLSLRQFIYAGIVIVLGFINFKLAMVNFFLIIPLLPPMLFFALLAAPIGTEQSSEIWLLAKIGFFIKPRKRIWNQTGVQELVTVTAPKKVERVLTDNLSQDEVKSRLQALATTLDSRGWAVKSVNVNLGDASSVNDYGQSDRLIQSAALPQNVPDNDITAGDDIMDQNSNPLAQNMEMMLQQSRKANRRQILQQIKPEPTKKSGKKQEVWLVPPPSQIIPSGYTTFNDTKAVSPGSLSAGQASDDGSPQDQALLQKIMEEKLRARPNYKHLKTLDPLPQKGSTQAASTDQNNRGQNASGNPVNPDILRLAGNDDLNVSTIAREANRENNLPDGEVFVSLH